MNTKHTPLPYNVSYDGKIIGPREGSSHIIVCEMPVWWPSDRNKGHASQDAQEANAQFIVTACNAHYDLLEACKSMLDWMEFTIPNLDRYKVPDRLNYGGPISKARAAIAKAHGKVPVDPVSQGFDDHMKPKD